MTKKVDYYCHHEVYENESDLPEYAKEISGAEYFKRFGDIYLDYHHPIYLDNGDVIFESPRWNGEMYVGQDKDGHKWEYWPVYRCYYDEDGELDYVDTLGYMKDPY